MKRPFKNWDERLMRALVSREASATLDREIRERMADFFARNPGVIRDAESEAVLTVIFFEAQEGESAERRTV